MKAKYFFLPRQQYVGATVEWLWYLSIVKRLFKTPGSESLLSKIAEAVKSIVYVFNLHESDYNPAVKYFFGILPRKVKLEEDFFELFISKGVIYNNAMIVGRKIDSEISYARSIEEYCGDTKPIPDVTLIGISERLIYGFSNLFDCTDCLQAREKHIKCIHDIDEFHQYRLELKSASQPNRRIMLHKSLLGIFVHKEFDADNTDEASAELGSEYLESYRLSDIYVLTLDSLHPIASRVYTQYVANIPSNSYSESIIDGELIMYSIPIPRIHINSADSLQLLMMLRSISRFRRSD